jgi:protein-tyrosine phosphatase
MVKYVYDNLFIADPQDEPRSKSWTGKILNLDKTGWQGKQKALDLPVSGRTITEHPTIIADATNFIHQCRKDNIPVMIWCPLGKDQSAVFAIAYLLEYCAMSLADAYTYIANILPSFHPPFTWIYALVQFYGLPYSNEEVFDEHFISNLMLTCQQSIHCIDSDIGVYISAINAMREPQAIRDLGIHAIVRLDENLHDEGQWPADFILLHKPIRDGYPLPSNIITETTAFIHQQLQNDNQVLVHCRAGTSRSVTIVLAYLIEYTGMTLLEAFKTVVQKRPVADPHPELAYSLINCYALPYMEDQIFTNEFLYNLLQDGGENQ